MERSTALNVVAFLVALGLFFGPLAVPPEEPSNRVEYTVDPFEDPAWESLSYEDLAPDERELFDAARADPSDSHTVPREASPDELTPPPGGIDHYSVHTDAESYMLQVTHYNEDIDVMAEVVPRIVIVCLGIVVGSVAAYRQVL